MAKLSVVPRSVNPFRLPISHQIEARIPCPWRGSQMYLDHLGERLLCVDTIHCAGVLDATQVRSKACGVKGTSAPFSWSMRRS